MALFLPDLELLEQIGKFIAGVVEGFSEGNQRVAESRDGLLNLTHRSNFISNEVVDEHRRIKVVSIMSNQPDIFVTFVFLNPIEEQS